MRAVVVHKTKDLRLDPVDVIAPTGNQVAVHVRAGGICGSDLHYYHHGGFGAIRLQEPMILGHEVAGEVAAVGDAVTGIEPGDLVAINPSVPCGQCYYCQHGQHNQCLDMRFYGSAMRFPHVQGAFSEYLLCEVDQCVTLPAGTDIHHAAFAEPLAVGLHALNRIAAAAEGVAGKRVLVSGCGPIGCLALMAIRHAGAAEVVALDVADHVLSVASSVGADEVVNVSRNPSSLARFRQGKGYFDVVVEASGAEPAFATAVELIRPRGVLAQLGLGGDIRIPMNACVAKEVTVLGSFRFHVEFRWAANLIASGEMDVSPLLTATIPIDDAPKAFDLAADRNRAVKVQLKLN